MFCQHDNCLMRQMLARLYFYTRFDCQDLKTLFRDQFSNPTAKEVTNAAAGPNSMDMKSRLYAFDSRPLLHA